MTSSLFQGEPPGLKTKYRFTPEPKTRQEVHSMKHQAFRSEVLFWFFLTLLGFSLAIFNFTAPQPFAEPTSETVSIEHYELEPTGQFFPEPSRDDSFSSSGPVLHFIATAYSVTGTTFSGVLVNTGIVAADPEVMPIGSVIDVSAGRHSGIYTVLDTGPAVKGQEIDIYIPEKPDALQFGRRKVRLRVLRFGWDTSSSLQPISTQRIG